MLGVLILGMALVQGPGSESPRIVTEVPRICVGVRMSGLGFGGRWLQSLGRSRTTPIKLYKSLQYDASTLQKPL